MRVLVKEVLTVTFLISWAKVTFVVVRGGQYSAIHCKQKKLSCKGAGYWGFSNAPAKKLELS